MRRFLVAISIALFTAAQASAAMVSLTAKASFGGGDGWRAPGEVLPGDTAGTANAVGPPAIVGYNYLQTGSLERGLAYNPVTGNLVLVSRSTAGNGIRLLDGTTGADVGALNQGSGIITGGTFFTNMVGVADDGAVYVGNLSTAAASAFKVYRWADSAPATTPTPAFNLATGITRVGDSLAVYGAGAGTKIAAAGTNNVLASNFAVLSTTDGLSYTHTSYTSVAGTLTTSNDYRLGLTFVDSDTLIGSQGANGRITDFAASATVTATIPLGAAQRPVDYAVINGVPLLATIDSNGSGVQVFDITTPASPILLASGNLTSGTLVANGNGSGGIAFGNITSNSATLYAMTTNQGIQAFDVSVIPEPAGVALALLGVVTALATRRRS